MIDDSQKQSIIDKEHLRLVSIGFYVLSIYNIFKIIELGLYYILHGPYFVKTVTIYTIDNRNNSPYYYYWHLASIVVLHLVLAIFQYFAAIYNQRLKAFWFCVAISVISVPFVSLSTALGIAIFIVYIRPSVYKLFNSHQAA